MVRQLVDFELLGFAAVSTITGPLAFAAHTMRTSRGSSFATEVPNSAEAVRTSCKQSDSAEFATQASLFLPLAAAATVTQPWLGFVAVAVAIATRRAGIVITDQSCPSPS